MAGLRKQRLFALGLVVVMLLGLSVTVAGCGKKKNANTLVFGSPYGPKTFDPAFVTEQGGMDVNGMVFDSLMTRTPDNQMIPRLALSYENPDPTTWIFHLRQGAYWQDDNAVFAKGKAPEVTAADVVYTVKRLLDPATTSPRKALVDSVQDVVAVDKYTAKITTKTPDAFFLTNIGELPIVNKTVVDTLGADKFGHDPIGSGPFKFVEYVPDSHVTLTRNDRYYIKPNLQTVTYKIIPDQNTLYVSLESGDVDAIEITPQQQLAAAKANPDFKVLENGMWAYRYAAFNCKDPLFTDPKVRQAIAMSVDLDGALTAIFPDGSAIRAHGPVPPKISGYDETLKDLWQYNPDKAKQTLADLGWKDHDGDGILDKNGKPFEFSIEAPANDTPRIKFAVVISEGLKAIGVKGNVKTVEWGTLISDMDNAKTQMYVVGGFSGASGMKMLFSTATQGSAGNNSFYSNPQVDRLLEEGSQATDPATHEQIWKQAQRIIVGDWVHIPLYFQMWYTTTSSKVHDFWPSFTLVSTQNNCSVDR